MIHITMTDLFVCVILYIVCVYTQMAIFFIQINYCYRIKRLEVCRVLLLMLLTAKSYNNMAYNADDFLLTMTLELQYHAPYVCFDCY